MIKEKKPYAEFIDPLGIPKGNALLYRLGQHTIFLSFVMMSIDGMANMK